MSDDEIFDTFDEWEQAAQKRFDDFVARGMILEKVMVDPDDLAVFAAEHAGGKVDGTVRGAFAASLLAKKYGGREN
jgi:hypothetical protein